MLVPAIRVQADDSPASQPASAKAALELKLPKPAFKGTPKDAPKGANLEPARRGPRPPLMVPAGVKLLSKDARVTSSDNEPIVGKLSLVTDGDAEATEGGYVELGPGVQWVQIDLGATAELHAIVVWHFHASARIYHDVIVQVSDDANFINGVRTLFNNDHDNSAGLGVGRDKEYWETYEGKLIEPAGEKARYVRLYSRGSTADDQNHYTEVSIFGIAAGK
ncbi:MAG: hypothetical protein IPM64_03330 [Phycisphaerales bacterium]|nr:hypothetical protein [Phycisphaerales bacterium]